MNKRICIAINSVFLFFLLLFAGNASAQPYLFFLHNRFLENHKLSESHKEYGKAEYNEIVSAFTKSGFTVISEKRKPDTDARDYARKVTAQIDSLLKRGVAASDITVVGTSKGGYIAQYVSTYLRRPDVNFVFVGCYMHGDVKEFPDINICGNVLMIYEKTDINGVTAYARRQASNLPVTRYREVELNTGMKHGFLYKALPAWMDPATQWAKKQYDLGTPYIQEIEKLLGTTGIYHNGVIMITRNGIPEYIYMDGYADPEKKTMLQSSSQYVIGSISKQITAVLVLQQVEKGVLQLHQPVRRYLPALSQPWADTVTIHHLLTHMDGIVATDKPLKFKPGTKFSYNQVNFQLLAEILEKTTNRTFASLAHDLFEWCGMENTFHPDKKGYKKLLAGYSMRNDGEFTVDSASYKNIYVAAGGFISTADDLVLWNEALHHGKLLKDSTYRQMLTKYPGAVRDHPLFGKTEYGYGTTISTSEKIAQVGQTGFVPGFPSMNFYFPASGVGVIVLQNFVGRPDDLKKSFALHTRLLGIVRASALTGK